MPRASTDIEVFCSAEDFLKVVKDVESYPEFLDEMKQVEVLDESDDGARVKFFVEVDVAGMAVKSEYTLDYTFDENEVSWELHESENLTKNEGKWEIEPIDEFECKAHYVADVETNLPIPAEVQKMFAEQELPKLAEAFQDRAEDLYD